MNRYTLMRHGPNIYILCNGVTIACFVGDNPRQKEDANCARLALERAETERITNQATIAEQTN